MTDGQEAALGRGAEVRGSPHTARRTTGGRRARARESRAVARSFKTILSCVSFLLRAAAEFLPRASLCCGPPRCRLSFCCHFYGWLLVAGAAGSRHIEGIDITKDTAPRAAAAVAAPSLGKV